jgi:asparagine synthetase A
MSYEMHGVLSGAISLTTWEKVMPAYGNEPESFLNNVVTPIYNVLKKVLFNVSSFFFLWIFSSIKLSYLRTKGS